MTFVTLAELAHRINAELRGDDSAEITGINSLDATAADEVTFIADAARLSQAQSSSAAAFIVPFKLAESEKLAGRNLLIVKDAKLAFARAIQALHARPYESR